MIPCVVSNLELLSPTHRPNTAGGRNVSLLEQRRCWESQESGLQAMRVSEPLWQRKPGPLKNAQYTFTQIFPLPHLTAVALIPMTDPRPLDRTEITSLK